MSTTCPTTRSPARSAAAPPPSARCSAAAATPSARPWRPTDDDRRPARAPGTPSRPDRRRDRQRLLPAPTAARAAGGCGSRRAPLRHRHSDGAAGRTARGGPDAGHGARHRGRDPAHGGADRRRSARARPPGPATATSSRSTGANPGYTVERHRGGVGRQRLAGPDALHRQADLRHHQRPSRRPASRSRRARTRRSYGRRSPRATSGPPATCRTSTATARSPRSRSASCRPTRKLGKLLIEAHQDGRWTPGGAWNPLPEIMIRRAARHPAAAHAGQRDPGAARGADHRPDQVRRRYALLPQVSDHRGREGRGVEIPIGRQARSRVIFSPGTSELLEWSEPGEVHSTFMSWARRADRRPALVAANARRRRLSLVADAIATPRPATLSLWTPRSSGTGASGPPVEVIALHDATVLFLDETRIQPAC